MQLDSPIALYNTEKKELIGVFKEFTVLAKYLFPHYKDYDSIRRKIANSLTNQKRFKCSIFEFEVTCRYAKKQYTDELGEHDFFVIEGYPTPNIKGMSNKYFLYIIKRK